MAKRKKITTKWDRRRRKIEGKLRFVWIRKHPQTRKIQVRRRLSHID
ncbi:hypothetical protein LCGC14_0957850 [marine sediment metagenome]|uniref:Uncharacterized protein n=1 Tax=marine sediment metagenome TaxID=412755 RepID=A0A0F9P1H1_9ZZZZ